MAVKCGFVFRTAEQHIEDNAVKTYKKKSKLKKKKAAA